VLRRTGPSSEGVFRVSGSAERIKELQDLFDDPATHGEGLDWAPFAVYDVADVFRRYLTQMPDAVVPQRLCQAFVAPVLRRRQEGGEEKEEEGKPAVAGGGAAAAEEETAAAYRKLVAGLPDEHRDLLVYLLDLLAFFAANPDETKMGAQGLATVFQPAVLSRPVEEMTLSDLKICQEALEFLIGIGESFAQVDGAPMST
jgi:GTPase-activating protein SAC7